MREAPILAIARQGITLRPTPRVLILNLNITTKKAVQRSHIQTQNSGVTFGRSSSGLPGKIMGLIVPWGYTTKKENGYSSGEKLKVLDLS